MSWNVESLGAAKAFHAGDRSKLIKFLHREIRREGADIVGLMELKGDSGVQVRDWLLAKLNNVHNNPQNPAYQWQASLSSRQDGGTKEEYLILWKNQNGRLTLNPQANPGPTWSIGVYDDNALATAYGVGQWTQQMRQGLLQTLEQQNVVGKGQYRVPRGGNVNTETYRVDPDAWNTISTQGAGALGFLSPAFSGAQQNAIATALLGIDILRFPTYGDRSPFVANFIAGNPGQPLTVVLFHAPGPGDPDHTDAIDIMTLSAPLQNATNLLLMGDFNVALPQWSTGRVYHRFTGQDGRFHFGPVVPAQTQAVFAPIESAPLHAPVQLDVPTSLVNSFLADNATVAETRASPYDRFFFRGTQQVAVVQNTALAVDMVSSIANNQATPPYNPDLARAGLTFFRRYRGHAWLNERTQSLQRKLDKLNKKITTQTASAAAIRAKLRAAPIEIRRNPKSALSKRLASAQGPLYAAQAQARRATNELAAVAALDTLVQTANAPDATGIGTAHSVYRHAVTDHLPIEIVLRAP